MAAHEQPLERRALRAACGARDAVQEQLLEELAAAACRELEIHTNRAIW